MCIRDSSNIFRLRDRVWTNLCLIIHSLSQLHSMGGKILPPHTHTHSHWAFSYIFIKFLSPNDETKNCSWLTQTFLMGRVLFPRKCSLRVEGCLKQQLSCAWRQRRDSSYPCHVPHYSFTSFKYTNYIRRYVLSNKKATRSDAVTFHPIIRTRAIMSLRALMAGRIQL